MVELFNEVRNLQALKFLKIIKKFLLKFPKIKSVNQVGKGTFNKKRDLKKRIKY